jgi:membrane-bound lytic murein transglycosylase D
MFHNVSRGDTLSQIAETYSTRVSTLVALNNIGSNHLIRADQRLRLPAAGPAPIVAKIPTTPEPEVRPVPEVVEAMPGAVATAFASSLLNNIQTSLLSDPSDYSVATDRTIEVQPLETLGHFGDWLEIKTQRLRDLNGLAFRTPVSVGQRIRLDLDTVDAQVFEERRIAYHRAQQDRFFREHVISGVTEHTIQAGEAIWILALRKYDVPIWLFRQYNPSVNMHKIRPGTKVQIPLLTDVDRS